MKRSVLALLFLAAAARAANLPLQIPFQGRLTDPATGSPRNGAFDLTFRLYDVPTGGAAAFVETQNGVAVNNGVFTVHIGTTAALPPDLFQGASAYLGVTVAGDSEMTPRHRLLMSAYAYSASQLVADSSARVRVGAAYSTFTASGGLDLSGPLAATSGGFSGGVDAASADVTYGLSAGSAAVAGSLTASSATFTAAGAGQFSVQSSSGVDVQAGTLRARGTGGAHLDHGVTASTAVVGYYVQSLGSGAPPVSPPGAGRIYFDSAADRYMASENGGTYVRLLAPSASQDLWDSNATASIALQGQNLPLALTELDGTITGPRVQINCDDIGGRVAMRFNMRNLTATARTIDIQINDVTNTANVLVSTSIAVAATAGVTYLGETDYVDKPAWCAGKQTIGVWTAGGNGGADYIFRRVGVVWKP